MTVIPNDYDRDPDRAGSVRRGALARDYPRGDVHPGVAERIAAQGCRFALDVGGGTGTLTRLVTEAGVTAIVVDQSPAQLAQAPAPKVRADGHRLPFRDGCVDAVAMLWTLYHFEQPILAIEEARRVLRPGGVFVTCAPSRWNDPELAAYLPAYGEPSVFDAELAPDLVGQVFGEVEVDAWDAQLLTLQDQEDLATFLRGQLSPPDRIPVALHEVKLPLPMTKRGCLVWASR